MTAIRLDEGDLGLRHVWATDIAFASVNVAQLLQVPVDDEGFEFARYEADQHLRDTERVRQTFGGAARSIALRRNARSTAEFEVQLWIEVWRGGFEAAMVTSPADYLGWLFLSGDVVAHSDAGTVAILDPRAGSNMVAVPGIPWGRPLVLAPRAGTLAVVPSWLTASVLPLDPGQEVVVVRAEIFSCAQQFINPKTSKGGE